MLKWLALLSVWLALPALAWAATGDACHFVTTTPTAQQSLDIPLPTDTNTSAPQIGCKVLCDITAAGAFSCGPMWVPGGGQNIDLAIIRALSGTSAAGCRYDSVTISEMSNQSTAAGSELVSIGVLDAQGTSGGVKQIKNFGPIGPYIFASGTATAGTCDATHHLMIQFLYWTKPAVH